MVQVDCEQGVRPNLICGADNRLEHPLIGICPRSLAYLDDKRGAGIDASLEQPHGLFQVVNVVRPNGIVSVRVAEAYASWHYHNLVSFSTPDCSGSNCLG